MWDLVKVTFLFTFSKEVVSPSITTVWLIFPRSLKGIHTHTNSKLTLFFHNFFFLSVAWIFLFFFSWSCCTGLKIKAYRFTDPVSYISAFETNVRSSLTALMGHTCCGVHTRTHTHKVNLLSYTFCGWDFHTGWWDVRRYKCLLSAHTEEVFRQSEVWLSCPGAVRIVKVLS